MPCWFTVSSGMRPNAPPKSCTGCCTSSPSSSPWWAWWRCSTTTGRRATPTCTACTAGVAFWSSSSFSCRHVGLVPGPTSGRTVWGWDRPRAPADLPHVLSAPAAAPAGGHRAGGWRGLRSSREAAHLGRPWAPVSSAAQPPAAPRLSSQWLVGFSFFLFPGASFSLRSRYRPQHVFLGGAIFLLSVGTALLGLKEALLFELGTKYSKFEPEGVLANVLGLLLAAFGAVVLYILTRADWKRPLQAEEQALSMDFKTLTEGDSPSSQ
ncbi:uncharacterized protein LOC103000520 isoform X3 [Balaenoptera acutorostrata]|uniref:Transmembrane ascorbate-dependent reductase CYB561 n=1 Tax=Balaenoptera acutorostrata TaxID=9767 RepID=A0ABM3SR32_BALAC|nr:uncharacterized protein LOC103000520 isoform X3 [Balaenoptera acutorostrata]